MQEPYHYIGLDIHKRAVAFCEKRPDGATVDAGTFTTRRDGVQQWVSERTTPWIAGMEATLFTGFLYDVLTPYAVEIRVGHPLQLKAISCAKHKSDRIDAETLANLLRADLFPECYMASPLVRELLRTTRNDSPISRRSRAIADFAAVHEQQVRTAMGEHCLETGGLAVEPCLNRLPETSYENVRMASGNKEGRPPALPVDFYL